MYKRFFKVNRQSKIDDFIYDMGISKKMLKDIKMKGDILVNGVHQTVRYQVKVNDEITLIYPTETCAISPNYLPLQIVYEDDYILVVDKPKNLACIPTRTHPSQTLANALSYYYQQKGLKSTVHLVNRLDRETSGLMIVAKYREVHDLMTKQMQHIYRKYRAHVVGKINDGTVDLPIYKDGHKMQRIIDERGKKSVTHYRCIHYENGISLVECVLETGRTHQIRVHMASIGHPLIGDSLYGNSEGEFDLKSVMVAFVHPITNQKKVIIKKGYNT